MKKIFLLLLLALSMIVATENTRDIVRHAPLNTNGKNVLGKSIKDFGKYYALLIAVENYKNLKVLKTPFEDIETIGEMLEARFGFEKPILVKDPKNSDELLGILDDMQVKLTEDDNLLIYYAGHGSYSKRTKTAHWQLKNAEQHRRVGWISLDSAVNTTLRGMKAKHILVVADSCYSGALVRDGGVSFNGVDVDDKDYYEQIDRYKSRTALTSGGNEPVQDSDGQGGKHSIFAKAFVKTLQKNNKNLVSVEEIFPQLKRYVVLNADQTPEYADIKKSGIDELGGDFIFVDHKILKERRAALEKNRKHSIKPIVQKPVENSLHDSQEPARLKAQLAKLQNTKTEKLKENKDVEKYSLTINPTPSDAKVYISNIKPRYKDGMMLKEGSYKIKVKAQGYKTKIETIYLTKSLMRDIVLEKEKINIPKESSSELKWITPKNSICLEKGGKINQGNCTADWTTANEICLASGGRLASLDELRKVVSDCGGVNVEYGNKNFNQIAKKNEANKSYQKCYKAKGFVADGFWSSTTDDSDNFYAGIVDFYDGTQYEGKYIADLYVRCVRAGQ